jgi:hypothetical protein
VAILTKLSGFCLEESEVDLDSNDTDNGSPCDHQIQGFVDNGFASARTLAARQLLWGLYLAVPKTVVSLVPQPVLATCLAAALPPPPTMWCAQPLSAPDATGGTPADKARAKREPSAKSSVEASGSEFSGASFVNAGKTLEKYADAVDDAAANWRARSDDSDDAEKDPEADDCESHEESTLVFTKEASCLPAATAAVRPVVNSVFEEMAAAVEALESAASSPWWLGNSQNGALSQSTLLRFQEERSRAVERTGRALRRCVELHPLEFLAFLPRIAALCWQDAGTPAPATALSANSLPLRCSSATTTGVGNARGKVADSDAVEPVVMGDTSMELDDSAVPHSAGVCFNWENWGVCTRGARCRFYHDLTLAAPLGAYKGRDDRAAAINQQAANSVSSGQPVRLASDATAGAFSPFVFLPAQLPRMDGGRGTLAGSASCFVIPTLWGDAFQESLWAAAFDAVSALPPSLLLLPVPGHCRRSDSGSTFQAAGTVYNDNSYVLTEPPLPFAAGSAALLLAATARLGATQRALAASRESTRSMTAASQQVSQQSEASSAIVSTTTSSSVGTAASNSIPDSAGALPSANALPSLDDAVTAAERVVAAAFDLLSVCRAERPEATAQLLGDSNIAAGFGLPCGALGRGLGVLGVSLETLDEASAMDHTEIMH